MQIFICPNLLFLLKKEALMVFLMKRKTILRTVFICMLLILTTSSGTSFSSPQNHMRVPSSSQATGEHFSEIILLQNQEKLELLYPLSTTPIIVEKTQQFSLQVRTEEFDNVYVLLSTAYEPVVDEFLLSVTNIEFENTYYTITVSLPLSVPEELYNLTVLVEDNGRMYTDSQPRAVSVVDEISDDFSFIHLTDLHLGDPRGFTESIRQTLGWKSIRKCIEEVNLLKPDFVIISGDLVFGQLYPNEYAREYPKCYRLLQEFDVPTYLAPGNHDCYRRIGEDGVEYWQDYFGPLYHSFEYGTTHFTAVNSYDWPAKNRLSIGPIAFTWGGSIRQTQLSWLEDDLEGAQDATLRFLFLHHNPLWDTTNDSLIGKGYQNRQQLLSLINTYNVDMVLAGHVHYDNVTIQNNTIFLTTTTPESEIRESDGYWGYRMITVENGTITSYNYKEPKYSIPSYHLAVTTKTIARKTKATITNDLDIDITAHIQITLPKASYTIDNALLIQQRENAEKVEYYLQTTIPSRNHTTITLTRKLLSNT